MSSNGWHKRKPFPDFCNNLLSDFFCDWSLVVIEFLVCYYFKTGVCMRHGTWYLQPIVHSYSYADKCSYKATQKHTDYRQYQTTGGTGTTHVSEFSVFQTLKFFSVHFKDDHRLTSDKIHSIFLYLGCCLFSVSFPSCLLSQCCKLVRFSIRKRFFTTTLKN